MDYKPYVTLSIAVIGGNKVSRELTKAFALAGHDIYIANKAGEQIEATDFGYLENIYTCGIEEAAICADFILIATPPQHVREVAYWLGDVRRKVIIDLTPNALEPGAYPPQDYINTVGAISAITGSPHIVKAFNIAGLYQVFKPLFGGLKVDMLLAGDSKKAKEITKIIMRELCINNFYDFGGSETFQLLDELAKSWNNMAQLRNKFNYKLGITN